MSTQYRFLPRTENQARGIAQYALDFLRATDPLPDDVVETLERFHLDSVACGVAALGLGMTAPRVLRAEAERYPCDHGAALLGAAIQDGETPGGTTRVHPEKAVLANCSAVRELDSNGTNFGYNPRRGAVRGEFGHNDFYPVVVAAAQQQGWDGARTLRGMLCLDEIRGRLAEVFALRDYRIDHVLHGAIASAAVYAAALGGDLDQIESAIGLVVAHHVPFRAIRAGTQLSDSKGASAAISSEAAVQAAHRALRGFRGPADIFRNPQAVFRLFEPTPEGQSPFDLEFAVAGDDFAICGMHFKLGLYEHQSAGALQAVLDVLQANPALAPRLDECRICIQIYEPAFSIIGDPAKRDPRTRQSADHSMVYIVGRTLARAMRLDPGKPLNWETLMLLPEDYSDASLADPLTRQIMERIEFAHGGPEFDAAYPEGIPTHVEVEHPELGVLQSDRVMFPLGHARNRDSQFSRVLEQKTRRLLALGGIDDPGFPAGLLQLARKSAQEIQSLYSFPIPALSRGPTGG